MSENKSIKYEDYIKEVSKQLKDAENDDTPFAMVNGEEMSVIGDANRTETKLHDYRISFVISKQDAEEGKIVIPENGRLIANHWFFSFDFEDVTITPRSDVKLLRDINLLMPFFYDIKGDGTVERPSDEELIDRFIDCSDEVFSAMQNTVASFMGIGDYLAKRIKSGSAIKNLAQLIKDFPEVFNEADVFFG